MTSNRRIDLKVPYVEKEDAKALGARWDQVKKTWYAPPGTKLEPLSRWIPRGILKSIGDDKVPQSRHSMRGANVRLSTVTATEVAAFVYCQEQWRLEHGLGMPSENELVREGGTRHHERNAAIERATGCALVLARGVAAAALLITLVLLLRR
jgi:hypothetical protein